jgi:hypothetical protein
MPQVSGCVLALDTFTQDIILKEERDPLWHIYWKSLRKQAEKAKIKITGGVIISLDQILKRKWKHPLLEKTQKISLYSYYYRILFH